MSIPTKERRDDIIYFLLNKVKHTDNQPQTVSFSTDDFENKVVEQDDLIFNANILINKIQLLLFLRLLFSLQQSLRRSINSLREAVDCLTTQASWAIALGVFSSTCRG